MNDEEKKLLDIMTRCEEIFDKDLFINGDKQKCIIYKDLKEGDSIDSCAFFFLNLRIPSRNNVSIMCFPIRDLYESIGNPLYTKDRILDLMNLGEFPYYYDNNELYFEVYYSGLDPHRVIYIHFDDNGNMDNIELAKTWSDTWRKGLLYYG